MTDSPFTYLDNAATTRPLPAVVEAMAGIHLDHAYVVLDIPGTGAAVFASNAVPLDLVP